MLYIISAVVSFHLCNHFSALYRYHQSIRGLGISWGINTVIKVMTDIKPSLHPMDILVGMMGIVIGIAFVNAYAKDDEISIAGKEFGSARWGTKRDIQPYINPTFSQNVILTRTERLTMESRPKDPKNARNKNVLVVGGSGSGKSRFHVKPNLMQMGKNVSYIVTDPKGSILVECGRMLLNHGYKIRVFNTINFKKSMKYNPFRYISSEKDILKLVTVLIENTTPEGAKSSDPFWTSAEKLLLSALIGYIWLELDTTDQNFGTLLDLLNLAEAKENDEDFKSDLDRLFDRLEGKDKDHFALRQYKRYKLAAGKTAKSILISVGARLAPFDIKEVREIMNEDDMDFDSIGEEKTALFIIVSDTDTTFNFIAAMMYSQLFNRLCELADEKYGGRLPYHVRILADEFANLGKIPNFDKLIATIRSREISVSIILQTLSQLKTIYKDAAQTIQGNCDSMLFLGGKESSTLKDISTMLGKRTVDYSTGTDTSGNSPSHAKSTQHTGRSLMTEDELAVMDGGKCILQIRGVRPFFSDKYDITEHTRYKELADYDKRNTFDVEGYVKCLWRVKESDVMDVFEV